MPQTTEGAAKVLASKIGIPLEEYQNQRSAGLKWCFRCKQWKNILLEFGKDKSRYDGASAYCAIHRRVKIKKEFKIRINPETGKPGPAPKKFRDGDKRQAREKVHSEIRNGRMPSASSVPCMDCGRSWVDGCLEHHYDHYLGYSLEHHLHVQAVCAGCHAIRGHKRGELKSPSVTRDMDKYEFEKLYSRHTLSEMETITGVPEETIRRWLKKTGCPLRVKGASPNG